MSTSATHQNIRKELGDLIEQEFSVRIEEIGQEDLSSILDSIKLLSLIIAIEDHWKVCLTPEDEQHIKSFDDLIDTIAKLKSPGQ